MSDFTQYRRKQIAELRPWTEGDDMGAVSVSVEDAKAGSPKIGDMIARNPKNHADQWLVAAAYFADNFESVAGLSYRAPAAIGWRGPTLRLLTLIGITVGLGATASLWSLIGRYSIPIYIGQFILTLWMFINRSIPIGTSRLEKLSWPQIIMICAWMPVSFPLLASWFIGAWVQTGDNR